MSFVCTPFNCQIILFDPWISPFQALPFRFRLDLGAMAMKGHSTFSKALALRSRHQIV